MPPPSPRPARFFCSTVGFVHEQNFGLITPVLTLLPRAHARWEQLGGIEEVLAIAVASDRLGFHHITCSEHVAISNDVAEVRGSRYWDPLATFGYLAAHTTALRFATHVLVLGYHHPLDIVKRYGTLDHVCGGRVILGVGVGSLREEFELLGAIFDGRGERADDALRALRSCFGVTQPHYSGSHYTIDNVSIAPAGPRRDVPIWIGGRTVRSLRRAVALGDGWVPFGLSPAEIANMLQGARNTDHWQQRVQPLAVWLQPESPVDPIDSPHATLDALRLLVDAGATGINLRFIHHSLAHYIEQLEALKGLAPQVASPN